MKGRAVLVCSFVFAASVWAAARRRRRFRPSAPEPSLRAPEAEPHAPGLRVETDSSRLRLQWRRIDDFGLAGLGVRSTDPPPPQAIAWRSIAGIDELATQAHRGRVLGFILGGAIGAGLGNAIGAGMRTPRDGRSEQPPKRPTATAARAP